MKYSKFIIQKLFSATLLFSFFISLFSFAPSAPAQTGGAFTIEKSSISSGGGTVAGGAFTVENTIGQPTAGTSQNPPFTIFGGFVTPQLAPTAAATSISGRIKLAGGKGIRNVRVTLTAANGESRVVLSGMFGTYRFEDVPIGETYFIAVSARRFVFDNPTQVVSLLGPADEIDFIGSEQW